MTDTDGLLSERIADLERQLAEAQENGKQLLLMCSQKTNQIDSLRGYLETCQDRYDHDMAEAEADIAVLKKGFIDVGEAFKVESLRQAIQNTLDTGMNRYIEEALEKITS